MEVGTSDAALQDFLGVAPLPTFVGEFSLSVTECTKYLVSECYTTATYLPQFQSQTTKMNHDVHLLLYL
jgi:hypothetical protein